MKLYTQPKKNGKKAIVAIMIAATLAGGAFAAVAWRIGALHPEDGLYLVFPKTPMTFVAGEERSRLVIKDGEATLWREANYDPESGFSLAESAHVSFQREGVELLVCGSRTTLTRSYEMDAVGFHAVNKVVCDEDACHQNITVKMGRLAASVYQGALSPEQSGKLSIAHDALVSFGGTMLGRGQTAHAAARAATTFGPLDEDLDEMLTAALGDGADISAVAVHPEDVEGTFSTRDLNEWTYSYLPDPRAPNNKVTITMDSDGVVTQEQTLPNGQKLTVCATKSGVVQVIQAARYRDMTVSFSTIYNPNETASLSAQDNIEHDLAGVAGAASLIAYVDRPKYSEDQMRTAGAKVLYNAQSIDTRFLVPILRDIQGARAPEPTPAARALKQGIWRDLTAAISRLVCGS